LGFKISLWSADSTPQDRKSGLLTQFSDSVEQANADGDFVEQDFLEK
jgi:hypothetical protein